MAWAHSARPPGGGGPGGSGAGSGLPSTRMRSLGETSSAGLASTVPLTLTRPCSIQRSASRREHSPARASALAMRIGPAGAAAAGGSPGRDP